MAVTLEAIWRHPIKGIGAEPLSMCELTPGRPLPLDRAWALLEAGGDAGEGWRSCRNFLRGAKGPSLMAITAQSEAVEGGHRITLTHPEREPITLNPDSDGEALKAWVQPIYPDTKPAAADLVTSPPEGMSDANFASVSVLNMASLRALSQKLGQTLDPRRFRGNLWLEGLAPWEEFDLVGQHLSIGEAQLEVVEPIGRCRATEANPETGRADAKVLSTLSNTWGHTQFGAYAMVRSGGQIKTGDAVVVT